MTEQRKIPNPAIAVIAEVLANHYTHSRLNILFMESGAPGDPPAGNKVDKCMVWLKRCNSEPSVDAISVLGQLLEEFMEVEISEWGPGEEYWNLKRDRIRKALAKYGLSYHHGGKILGGGPGVPSRSLKEILEDRDLAAIETEFQRAVDSIESDPAVGITAACSIIESLCKVYIEDEKLELPSKQTVKNLWKVVRENIGFDPGSLEDKDISRILSGFTSVVDGIGALRTHVGSAHGRGRKIYKLEPRHARLSIHAAHTLVSFVLETWDARKKNKELHD